MSTFSTTVTQAQRDAIDYNTRGRAISTCSRQNTLRPGYNPSPYEPKPTKLKPTTDKNTGLLKMINIPSKQEAAHAKLQVRPNTKRGQRRLEKTSKDIALMELPVEVFLEMSSCGLATPRDVFIAIHSLSHGKPCVGCAYDVHSKSGCPAKQQLLRERDLIK